MRWRTVLARRCPALAVVALLTGLPACSRGVATLPDHDADPAHITITPLPLRFADLGAGATVFTDVSIDGIGVLLGTADWRFASNDVEVFVTRSCAAVDLPGLAGCEILGRTRSAAAKPEHLAVSVTGGVYRVWVANVGPSPETGILHLTATFTTPRAQP
jgi:hypothetical protein